MIDCVSITRDDMCAAVSKFLSSPAEDHHERLEENEQRCK